ncbi:MAG: hypothetical protein RLZZ13_453 [Pseudomonadota bacterium]|jgi:hypothetical protein
MNKREMSKRAKQSQLEFDIVKKHLSETDLESLVRWWIEVQTYKLKRETLEEMPLRLTHSINEIQSIIDEFKIGIN